MSGLNPVGIPDAIPWVMLAPLGPINDLTSRIIAGAIEVHRVLGPGLLESVYAACLAYELQNAELTVERERSIPIVYKTLTLDKAFRLDALVNDIVIVETKAVEHVIPLHKAQLLTHMKLAKKPVGLLLNFNVPIMKQGITRLLNKSALDML